MQPLTLSREVSQKNREDFRRIALEAVLLCIFLFAFVYYGLGNLVNYRLDNPLPLNYAANDAFVYSAYSRYALQTEQVRTLPLFFTHGYGGLLFDLPPLRIIGEIGLSKFAGISIYDSIYVMLAFYIFFAIMLFYLLLRSYAPELAMLSLPATFILFSFPFSTSFYWGIWSLVSGFMYLPAILVLLRYHRHPFFPPLMILLLAGQIISYLRITPFILLFIIGYYAYLFWKRKLLLARDLPRLGIILVGCLLLSSYSLYLLNVSYGAFSAGTASYYLGIMAPSSETNIHVPLITDLGWLNLTLAVLGILLIIIFEKYDYPFMVLLYFFLLPLSNYFLFNGTVFKLRLLWPLFISGLIGFAIYYFTANIHPFLRKNATYICFGVAAILILAYASRYAAPICEGLVHQEDMMAYQWLRDNTTTNSRILYYYGEYFVQSTYTPSERDSYFVDTGSYLDQGQNLSRRLKISGITDSDMHSKVMRTGFLSFSRVSDFMFQNLSENIRDDICRYDYFVFGQTGRGIYLEQNSKYLQALISSGNPLVYSNPSIKILKNERGENCANESI